MNRKQSAPTEWPEHIVHHDSLHIPNKGEFIPGESVWVAGWSRSKRATYILQKIVENTRNGQRWVDVWENTPTTSRIRSVTPDRLGKRRSRQ